MPDINAKLTTSQSIKGRVNTRDEIVVSKFYELPPGTALSLNGLNDVNVVSPASGSFLAYDSSNSQWIDTTAVQIVGSSVNISGNLAVGTITAGLWNGTAIADAYISSAATWNGKQNALTFGIADTNSLVADGTPVSGEFAQFTSDGLVSRTDAEVRSDIGLGSLATLNSLAFADLTTTPTTIAGYGITDAVTIDEDQNVGINGTLDVNSDTLRLTETSASLPYPDTGLVPAIELYRDVGSPVDSHNIGHLRFYGNADNNVKTEYASINVEVRDPDFTAIRPSMHFDLGNNDDDTNAIITTRVMTLKRSEILANVPFTAYDAVTLSSTSDDENAGPTLFLYRNSPTVADSDVLGQIQFQGRKIVTGGNLSQGGAETYAHIQAKVTDKTFESEDGQLILSTMTAGADTEVLTLSGIGSTFNNQLSVTGDVNIVGSGYSSDLTSSIKPDNTNSSSSWKLTDKVLNINSASSAPTAMWLGDSGTKLYIIGSTNDDIDRFELTTPYDISSNIIATTSNDSGNGSVPQGMYFKSDGSRYWTVDSGPDYIRQYSLSTAWDIQTSSRSTNAANGKSYVDIRLNGDANPTGVAFSADGLKVIICGSNGAGSTGDSIYSYTLGTAFDIFTMVGMDGNNVAPSPDVRVQFSSFTDIRDEISLPHDIFFLPDGLTLYVVCRERDDIVTFTLGTAFDITTMTYNGHLSIDDIDGTVGAVYVDPVNNIGLMVGQVNDSVYQWTVDNNALIVDAQSTQFKGQLGVYDDLTVDGDIKISGKSFYKGALISSGTTTTFGNTILGNTTGVYTRIGHTSGTATLDFGRSIKSQIINLHGGVTESGETKTLNIGTGGDSGSTTNITIGTATAGATQTTTVNGALTVNSDLFEITSTVDDATEKPIISLYRDAGVPGPNDELGAIRWFGQNASDEKQFYGGIYAQADVITDGAHKGSLNFHLADGSNNGTAISDVLVDINGDEDPTMNLTAELLTLNAGLIVNNDFAEIVSAKADEHASPILSLYRNSASPAINERIGGIRMFGENASGEKVFYAGIDGMTGSSVADGEHVGALRFYLADGTSSGDAVTDVSVDITTDEDPIMTLYKYGLVMRAGNDIFLATKDDVIEWQDTGSHDQKLQGRQSENSGADSLVTMPDGTGTLSLDGFNQTAYRSGEIIETLRGYADGRTLTGQATTAGVARNVVLEDVTAEQVLSDTYAKVDGTEFAYYPPAGTKTVLVEYQIFIGYDGSDIDPVFHHKIDVDGTVITQTQSTTRQEYRGHVYSVSEAIITVDGSGDLASGNIDSWTAAKTFRVLGREFGASNNVALHRVRIHDGSASATIINEPKIKITAIG